MNDNWNFISRMVMPVVIQNEPVGGTLLGLGDTAFEFFFSPKKPIMEGIFGGGGIFWGVGPMVFAPVGTDPRLSGRTWGAGVDVVALTQIPQPAGTLTIGTLATQTWSFAGPGTINALFLQPFIAFTFHNTVTIEVQSQSTLNWNQGQWTVPIIASVGKVFKIGNQLTNIAVGAKYYPVSPIGQPTWGLQFTVTLLYPQPGE